MLQTSRSWGNGSGSEETGRGRYRYLCVSHRHLESKMLSLKELQPLQQKSPDLEPLVLPTQTPPGLPDGGIREWFLRVCTNFTF